MWEHAGRGELLIAPQTCTFLRQAGMFCKCPTPTLQHGYKAIWVSYCSLGCLRGSSACWCHGKWIFFDIYTPQRPLHTNNAEQTITSCWLYPLSFLWAWYVLLPLCSMVMPSELAKCFSMDFKVLFKVLDLTAALQSLVIVVSMLPLSEWQKVCTASILTTRSFNSET